MVCEVFPDLETFSNYVFKLDKNIRYDNEMVKKEMESLLIKLKEQDGRYISLRELIKIISIDDIERVFPKEHGLYSLIINKIKNK